jgi:hypothetical protein
MQFQENIKAKFLYEGLIGNKTLFFYVMSHSKKEGVIINNQSNFVLNTDIEMGDLYDLYKSN